MLDGARVSPEMKLDASELAAICSRRSFLAPGLTNKGGEKMQVMLMLTLKWPSSSGSISE